MLTLKQVGSASVGYTYVFDNDGEEDCVILPLGAVLSARQKWFVNGLPESNAEQCVAEQLIVEDIPKQYAPIIGKDARSIDPNDSHAWNGIIDRAFNRCTKSPHP